MAVLFYALLPRDKITELVAAGVYDLVVDMDPKLTDEKKKPIILAAAGLRRLGWDGKIRQYLPAEMSIPVAANPACRQIGQSGQTEIISRAWHQRRAGEQVAGLRAVDVPLQRLLVVEAADEQHLLAELVQRREHLARLALSAGVPVLQSLKITKGTLGNRAMERVVDEVCEVVRIGRAEIRPAPPPTRTVIPAGGASDPSGW